MEMKTNWQYLDNIIMDSALDSPYLRPHSVWPIKADSTTTVVGLGRIWVRNEM